MIRQNFKTEIPLANYILIAGKFIYPINEIWTEGSANEYWTPLQEFITISDDVNYAMVGTYSVKAKIEGDGGLWYNVMSTNNTTLGINIAAIETKDSIPVIKFFMKTNNCDHVLVRMETSYDNYFEAEVTGITANGTNLLEMEIGNYAKNPVWTKHNAPIWDNINYITFVIYKTVLGVGPAYLWLDGFELIGNVIRGIYTSDCGQSSKDNCTIGCIKHYGCRMISFKDSIASTDTLNANDTTSPLSQVALYELLRCRMIRTTGTIEIPLNIVFKAGQIIHINGCWNGSGYVVDRNFRITEVKHEFSRRIASTTLTLIDDLYNSIPINSLDPYSQVMRIINPDMQTRTLGSLKIIGGDFDANAKPITADTKILFGTGK
jgi:hypothetical protein